MGIPSYNNARTIGHVVKAVSGGLAKYFPRARAVVVNSDGGSFDNTQEVVAQTKVDLDTILITHPVNPIHRIVTPYHGIPGKGSALRAIFQLASTLKAKACAVVDADLRSITPEWMEVLLEPIMERDYDYMAPYYLRHKYDGTITNNIVYPLTRALYGKRIRQPIGGDFGFSGELVEFFLSQSVWETDVARYGIDIWMTTTAVARGFKLCQGFLGAKIHDPKDPVSDLSAMLTQVMGSVFSLMEEYESVWMGVRGSEPVPILGFQYEVGLEPVNVSVDKMIASFRQAVRDLLPVWSTFLPQENLGLLTQLGSQADESFRIPDDLWARVIYDFAVACKRRLISRDHLLKSLTPLYLGKTASFVLETQRMSSREAEGRVEELCRAFEAKKPYLVERWRG